MQSFNGNLVAGQPAQALGVGGPVTGRVGGDAPVVVKVYALGRGVSLEGQRHNLLLREGAFKLEANGQIFVIDPLAAGHAHGFVAPVEGDITAILSLPQGIGKNQIAAQLAQALGCHSVVDEWTPRDVLTAGALHLTNEDMLESPDGADTALTPREHLLLDALECIVLETMAYPPLRPTSADSYLPADYIQAAQAVLGLYGRTIQPTLVPA